MDCDYAVWLTFEPYQSWRGVSVVPKVQGVVDRDPCMIDFGEKTHNCRHLCTVVLVVYLIRYMVHLDPLKWFPCYIRRCIILFRYTLYFALVTLIHRQEDKATHVQSRCPSQGSSFRA